MRRRLSICIVTLAFGARSAGCGAAPANAAVPLPRMSLHWSDMPTGFAARADRFWTSVQWTGPGRLSVAVPRTCGQTAAPGRQSLTRHGYMRLHMIAIRIDDLKPGYVQGKGLTGCGGYLQRSAVGYEYNLSSSQLARAGWADSYEMC